MIKIFLLILLPNLIQSQDYTITAFGIPITKVNQDNESSTKIIFSANNIGIPGIIWPTKNLYSAEFDSISYDIKKWEKKIEQGEEKNKLIGEFDPINLEMSYNVKNIIKTKKPTKNIFSLLAMSQSLTNKELDTKWFFFEHEGVLGRARFLWADTVSIFIKNNNVLCDHYRLDIKIDDYQNKLKENSDYFMSQIISPDIIRQIWVSRKPKRQIIKASIEIKGIKIIALIDK
tara:strand:- start:589 stop:1281 length:693 start_codon:yes stop_codon:yes gene_type:complete